jgi:transposase
VGLLRHIKFKWRAGEIHTLLLKRWGLPYKKTQKTKKNKNPKNISGGSPII